MVNAQPKRIAADIIEVAQAAGIAVILNRSWGGIEPPASLPTGVLAVDDVPFDGLFPRIQAAVHHGGSGTTHSALRCGIPQAIIPHIADQFFWSRQMVAAGFGVEAFPIRDWSRELFAQVVDALQKHIQHAV
jgi:sterol 3beta-glucosyltransferase